MNPEIGKPIEHGNPFRDAIHVAVAPVTAGCTLAPGDRVRIQSQEDGETVVVDPGKFGGPADIVGIVDPFLTKLLHRGERFWLFLLPGTVTSLRHDWTHPAWPTPLAPESPLVEFSRRWIEDLAEEIGCSYQDAIRAGREYQDSGRCFVLDNSAIEDVSPERWEKFWMHYSIITGIPVDEDLPPFRCSC